MCVGLAAEHLVRTGHTRHEQTINIGSDVIISWSIVTANGREVLDGAHFATLQLHRPKVSFIRAGIVSERGDNFLLSNFQRENRRLLFQLAAFSVFIKKNYFGRLR